MIRVVVYSAADEVELRLNGTSMGRKPAGKENRYTATFEIPYVPGVLEAVSWNGTEIASTAKISTTGKPSAIRLCSEPSTGSILRYVLVEIVDEQGNVVPNAELPLIASVEGGAVLAGFGSSKPVTAENYTSGNALSFNGRALAIMRMNDEASTATLNISSPGFEDALITCSI